MMWPGFLAAQPVNAVAAPAMIRPQFAPSASQSFAAMDELFAPEHSAILDRSHDAPRGVGETSIDSPFPSRSKTRSVGPGPVPWSGDVWRPHLLGPGRTQGRSEPGAGAAPCLRRLSLRCSPSLSFSRFLVRRCPPAGSDQQTQPRAQQHQKPAGAMPGRRPPRRRRSLTRASRGIRRLRQGVGSHAIGRFDPTPVVADVDCRGRRGEERPIPADQATMQECGPWAVSEQAGGCDCCDGDGDAEIEQDDQPVHGGVAGCFGGKLGQVVKGQTQGADLVLTTDPAPECSTCG